jgi:hypothetical protein
MHKLKVPGTWKLVTGDGWEPQDLQYDYFLKREISSECKTPRLISPSGSFWEGREMIVRIVNYFRKQKKEKG